MNKENIIIAIVAFVLLVIFFYFRNIMRFNNKQGKKSKKNVDIMEVKYLSITNNIDKERLMNKKMMLIFSIINACIVDIVFLFITIIPVPIFFSLLIGLVLFLGLIYSIYGILGRFLVKRGFDKK